MLVYKLCQKLCPEKIPEIGSRLGDGADGEVFDLKGSSNKVVKLCIKPWASPKQTEKVLNYIIKNPVPTYARVYEYVNLGFYKKDTQYCFSEFYLYYYTMEKLNKISEDERKVFHSILCHEDSNIEKNFSQNKVKKMLKGLGKGLDFDFERVIFFYDNCRKTQVAHLDIHVRNIMKDAAGNFKLIDFDRAQLLEKNNGKTE